MPRSIARAALAHPTTPRRSIAAAPAIARTGRVTRRPATSTAGSESATYVATKTAAARSKRAARRALAQEPSRPLRQAYVGPGAMRAAIPMARFNVWAILSVVLLVLGVAFYLAMGSGLLAGDHVARWTDIGVYSVTVVFVGFGLFGLWASLSPEPAA